MKTTSLLLAAAALMLGPSHGFAQEIGGARGPEANRCDMSSNEGVCRQAESTSDAQEESVAGAASGEPDDHSSASNIAPGNDGTAGGP